MLKKQLIKDKLNLVLNKLQNLERPENEDFIKNSTADKGKSIGYHPRDFGMDIWDWPQGVGLYGMYNLYTYDNDEKTLKYILEWYKKNIAGDAKNKLPKRNINTAAPLLTLSYVSDKLGKEYNDLCEDWVNWIINELPRTQENGFQHTTTDNGELGTINLNEGELWIDTLFMCVLLTARMGKKLENDIYLKTAVHQILVHIKYLYNKENGLFYHGYTFLKNNNFGGIYWGRGNSWFTSGVVDFIEIMGDYIDNGVKEFLIDTFKSQVNSLIKLQSECGLWHTILDDKTSYVEVSGTSGISYGILKGIRMGILDKSYIEVAEKAVNAILDNVDKDGTVLNVSSGTSMGHNSEHYKKIMIVPMAYGQSLTIMALTEALKSDFSI